MQDLSIRPAVKTDLIPPKYFNKAMKEDYQNIGEELVNAKLLARADLPVLEEFIVTKHQLAKANKLLLRADDIDDMRKCSLVCGPLKNTFLSLARTLGLSINSRNNTLNVYEDDESFDTALQDLNKQLAEGKITMEKYEQELDRLSKEM